MLIQVYVPEGKVPIKLKDIERHNHQVVRIDGICTGASKCSGYCSNNLHKGYLTEQLMQKHNCIENECSCYYFEIHNRYDEYTGKLEIDFENMEYDCDIDDIYIDKLASVLFYIYDENGPLPNGVIILPAKESE